MRFFLLAGFLAAAATAQTPSEPPSLIRIVRNLSGGKPASEVVRPYADAQTPVNVVGMSAVSGMAENWQIELHDSFQSVEELDQALAAVQEAAGSGELGTDDVLSPARRMIALYRPTWSYRPEEAVKLLPQARYLFASIFRIRPGSEVDFAELVKVRRAEFDSINSERPEMAYQVISGAPTGIYVFLAPLASLRTLDNGLARMPTDGVPRGKVADVSREHLIFRIEPRLSWAPRPK